MVLLPHGPEPCASANSATSAFPFLPFFSLGTYYFTHFFQNVKLFSFLFFTFFASTSTRKFIRLQQVPFLLRADPQGTFLYKDPLCPEYEKPAPFWKQVSLPVQEEGLEPSWYCYHTDLNRARLPIPPLLHFFSAALFISLSDMLNYIIKLSFCQQLFQKNIF